MPNSRYWNKTVLRKKLIEVHFTHSFVINLRGTKKLETVSMAHLAEDRETKKRLKKLSRHYFFQ